MSKWITMCGILSFEIMSLNNACIAFTNRISGYINKLAFLEVVYCYFFARIYLLLLIGI